MYSNPEDVNRLNQYSDKSNILGCWPWKGAINSSGYGKFWMQGKTIPAHRASFVLHHGSIPEGKIVIHSCDDKSCVNPAHLQVGTHQENMRDFVLKGKSLKGEKNFSAKLTETDVKNIIVSLQNKVPHREIARASGVSRTTIKGIANKRIWVHVWDQMKVILDKSSAENLLLTPTQKPIP